MSIGHARRAPPEVNPDASTSGPGSRDDGHRDEARCGDPAFRKRDQREQQSEEKADAAEDCRSQARRAADATLWKRWLRRVPPGIDRRPGEKHSKQIWQRGSGSFQRP